MIVSSIIFDSIKKCQDKANHKKGQRISPGSTSKKVFFAIVWQSFEIKVISFEPGLEVTDLDTLMQADTLDKNKMSDLETYCTCNTNNVIKPRFFWTYCIEEIVTIYNIWKFANNKIREKIGPSRRNCKLSTATSATPDLYLDFKKVLENFVSPKPVMVRTGNIS